MLSSRIDAVGGFGAASVNANVCQMDDFTGTSMVIIY